jgi:hypothetical protein
MDNHEPNWKPISVSLGKLVSSENKLGTFKYFHLYSFRV